MQEAVRAFAARDKNILEQNFFTVNSWSILQVVVMLVIGFVQVSVLYSVSDLYHCIDIWKIKLIISIIDFSFSYLFCSNENKLGLYKEFFRTRNIFFMLINSFIHIKTYYVLLKLSLTLIFYHGLQ